MPTVDQAAAPSSRWRIAVNIVDLSRVDETIRQLLLAGKVDRSAVIRTDPDRPDEAAVAFSCDALTAACICDTIRDHDRRVGDHPTRAYVQRAGGAWVKLPREAMLSRVVGGQPVLDPSIFPESVKPSGRDAPKPKRAF